MLNPFSNRVIIYLVSRYATYAIQFVASILVAVKLGPYYMGIWGFVLLIINYFQQINFGISSSQQVLMIQHKENFEKSNNYSANSLWLVTYLGVMVLLFYAYYKLIGIPYFEKYNVEAFMIGICVIAIMRYYNMLFINIFRIENLLNYVSFSQTIIVILTFLPIFFFKGHDLVLALMWGYILGNLLIVLSAFKAKVLPDFKRSRFSWVIQGEIMRKGLYLFLYSSCFYFIIISIRTIISYFYAVEEFGLFSFAFNLGNAIMLILEAFSFLVYPKIIKKLSSDNHDEITDTITRLRTHYISSAHFMVYLALPCFPVLLHFLPAYAPALTTLNLIALTVLMNANSFGYSSLLVARNKENWAAYISLVSLLLNCGLALLLVKVLHVGYEYVILATFATYLFFSNAMVYYGRKLLHTTSNEFYRREFRSNVRLAIPLVSAFVICLFNWGYLILVPLVLYVVFCHRDLKNNVMVLKALLTNPKMVDLK